jgi:hypothetical protein
MTFSAASRTLKSSLPSATPASSRDMAAAGTIKVAAIHKHNNGFNNMIGGMVLERCRAHG